MINCPECNGTGTETRERFMAGNVVEYHITCSNCNGEQQIEPMPQTITFERSSKDSGYVIVNGFTICIEVSASTDNVPLVQYWTHNYEEDTVTRLVPEEGNDG